MNKKLILILLILVLVLTSFMACSLISAKTYNTLASFNTNTTWQVSLSKTNKDVDLDVVWNKILTNMQNIEKTISIYDKNSDIYKFNHMKPGVLEISKITYDILLISKDLYIKTDKAFNPAVLPLVDLWGFTERFTLDSYEPTMPYDRLNFKEQLPQQIYIEAFKKLLDYDQIEVFEDNGKYYINKPDVFVEVNTIKYYMQIDLGGIGKGYVVDQTKKIIDSYNITLGYFACGSSSIYCFKKSDYATFSITFTNPRGDSTYMQVELNDIAISTSGDYEQYYVIDGKRYSHIINPFTGYPIDNNIIAASVLNDNATYGDAFATALLINGKDFINKLPQNTYVALTYIENNQKKVFTNNNYFKITSKDYIKA